MSFKLKFNTVKWRTELVKYLPEEGESEVVIPNKVSYICDEAFMDCAELQSVIIPDRVSFIGGSAFAGCKKLRRIKLPSSLRSIRENTFRGSGLVAIDVPDGVVSIKAGAFSGCSALGSITLPQSLQSIGIGAFGGCSSLTEIDIPAGVAVLPRLCFQNCTSLGRVSLHEGLEEVGNSAFYGCTAIERLDFPDSVLMWRNTVFFNCTSLKYIDFGECMLPSMRIVSLPPNSLPSLLAVYAPNYPVKDWTVSLVEYWGWFAPFAAAGYIELSQRGREFSEDVSLAFYNFLVNEIDEMVFLMFRNPRVLQFYIDRKLLSSEYADRLLDSDEADGRVEAKAMLLQYKASIGFDDTEYQL